MYCQLFKPLFDYIFSVFAFIICLPIILVVSILIKIESNGPIIFSQYRLGRDGNIFTIYKFRTMRNGFRYKNRQTFPNSEGVTKIGGFLRRFKIDEIPQFYNVLKGDMSIVGPRPCLPELRLKFDQNGIERLKVKPGLLSLADVNGGYYLSWPDRWKYDKKYVDGIGFAYDIQIILRSIFVVLFGEDFFLK